MVDDNGGPRIQVPILSTEELDIEIVRYKNKICAEYRVMVTRFRPAAKYNWPWAYGPRQSSLHQIFSALVSSADIMQIS